MMAVLTARYTILPALTHADPAAEGVQAVAKRGMKWQKGTRQASQLAAITRTLTGVVSWLSLRAGGFKSIVEPHGTSMLLLPQNGKCSRSGLKREATNCRIRTYIS